MASNLAIDDELITQAPKVAGLKTKKDMVNLALKEFIARRKQEENINLLGTIEYNPEYNHKKVQEAYMNVVIDTSVWSPVLRKEQGIMI